MELKSKK